MKTVTQELATHLNTEKNFTSCDLITLVLENGSAYRYTNADCDIIWDSQLYRHDALFFKRQQIKLQNQVSVDTLSVTLYTDPNHPEDKIAGLPLMAVAHSGVLDGAKLYLKRAFFRPAEGLPAASVVGVISLFGGIVEIKSSGGIKLELTVKAKTQGLGQEFPIRKYYPEGAYSTTGGRVISTGVTNDTCLIAPFVPRKEVLL